jgi:hypothetical protein
MSSQKSAFSPMTDKLVPMPVFSVFKFLGSKSKHAGIAQLPPVTAFDENHHGFFTPLFANITFHKSLFRKISN